jgi:hypothetical protein
VRSITIVAVAAILVVPAAGPSRAGGAPGLASPEASLEVSSAKKQKVKKKAAAKEQYLRAVPSTPPAGAKQ